MNIVLDDVVSTLERVIEPDSGKDILRLGLVRYLEIEDNSISLTIYLKDPSAPFATSARSRVTEVLRTEFGDAVDLYIEMDNAMIGLGPDLSIDGDRAPVGTDTGVLNTIAVASGKGGVGKSTVAVNLAISLASQGYDVGLVDTDIYGPSIPTMFGLEGARPHVDENRKIVPLEAYGVKLLSMGFLVDPMKAVVWRGPMVSGAVKQFLGETNWGNLDFLILDLPPGTGDIQLTIVQTIAVTGAVIVSTPQKVALADAQKGVAMFEQVNVPILGIVENMAYFTPPELPDKKYFIFGEGGARRLARELDIPLLAEIPLAPDLRESCDRGAPLASVPGGSAVFAALARKVARSVLIRNVTVARTEKIEITSR